MTDPNRCPTCGCELPADAGLCPECLLRQGFAENDSLAVEVGEDSAAGSGLPVTTPPAPFEPPPAEELATLFPGLEIVKLLGHGGMGAVYQARQTKLDRLVALKIIRPESASDPAFAERFLREARTLAKLSHPSIVGVHDFGEVETESASEEAPATTLYYFVMEYIDGANLRQLIEAGELAPEAAIGIVPQLCEALQFAHDQGVVHRDIKPENILVDSRGQVKIADFGLARLTEASPRDFTLTATHQVMGTPRYMAPEQMEGSHDVDHRADIYSLGVVFYEMLTGQVPAGHFDPPSKKAQIDVRLDEVVLRSLAREPERRYQQVSEVKTDVESISQTAASVAVATPPKADSSPESGTTQESLASDPALAIMAASRTRSEPLPAYSANPEAEISGKAIAAAAMVLCGAIVFPGLILSAQGAPDGEVALFLTGLMSLVALITAVAASGLGRVAIDQIRRSGGKLRGLRLAFIDVVLCPTIALNVLATAITVFLSMQATILANDYRGVGREDVQALGVVLLGLVPPVVIIAQAVFSFRILRSYWQEVSGPWPSEEELASRPPRGFCWKAAGGLAMGVLFLGLLMLTVATDGPFVVESSIYTRCIAALLCGVASCLIGRQAIRDIRNSNGQLSGLGLAFAATAVFPIALLNAAILVVVFFGVREYGELQVVNSQLSSAIVFSVPLWLIVDCLVLRRKWKQLSETASETDMPDRAPIATFRFSTSSDEELARIIPFHFEGLEYRLVKSTSSEWKFERGEKYSGLWSNDMRQFQTALTVRVEKIGRTTQVNCSWVVRTWGAYYTNSEVTRFEEEGRGLSELLSGEDETVTSPSATANDIESGRVGTSSVGRTAVGLLIFFGILFGIPFLLSLMMGSLGGENEDRNHNNGRSEVATTDAHDSGEGEESAAELAADQRRRNNGLRNAVVANELPQARQLLDDGADPNSVSMLGDKPMTGQTSLIMAAQNGNARMAALLLAMGADPSIQDNDGQTALMHAASKSHAEVIRVIFEICDQKFGNQVVFRDHLRRKADAADSVYKREDFPAVPTELRPINIDGLFIKSGEELQDSKGETALMKAAAAGDAESVKLLSGGGRPRGYDDRKALQICETQDKEGRTAFMHALLAGKNELIAEACRTESDFPKAGTNQLPSFCHTSVLGLVDRKGNSALDLASSDQELWEMIRSGLHEVLAWANGKLAGGVYLTNLQIPLRQRAEAYWALGHKDLAQADYDFKAQLDELDNPTLAGRIFALFEAAEQGNAIFVKKQLAEKVDPNSRNPAGETPLMKAVESGDLQTVVVLILRGADERAQDNLGRTPLMHAAALGQAEVVKLLLEMEQLHTNADLQFRLTRLDSELPLNTDFTKMRFNPGGLKDNLGRTAIFHAVQAEDVEATLALIRLSASNQTRDKADLTPLMAAVQAKSFEFLKQVAEKDNLSVVVGSIGQPSTFFYWNRVTGMKYVGDDTLLQYLEKNGATEAAKILRSKILRMINICTALQKDPESEVDSWNAVHQRAMCYRELGMIEDAEADEKTAKDLLKALENK